MHPLLNPHNLFDLATYKHASLFKDCQYVWEALNQLSCYLNEQKLGIIESEIPEGAFLKNPESIYIGKNTVVEPCTYISGPCWIGENCIIRQGAYIRGNVLTGNRCIIGHDTEIKNTIMLDGAQAAHFAYLGDSILGNEINLGAGTKCANLRLDRNPIFVQLNGEIIMTHRKKLGAILGDGTQLGCNSVTNPGTITGKSVFSYPAMNFGGYIPENSIIRPSGKPIIKQRNV